MKANNNQTNAEKKHGKLPVWKLKDLYSSQNDKNLSCILKLNCFCLITTKTPMKGGVFRGKACGSQ